MNPPMHDRNGFSTQSRLRDLWPPASRSGTGLPQHLALASSHLLRGSIAFFRCPPLRKISPGPKRKPTPLR